MRINEEKSKVVYVEKEAVRFLGFEIRLVRGRGSGIKFALMYASKKAVKGLYERIRAIVTPRMPVTIEGCNSKAEQVIEELGELLSGRACLEMIQQDKVLCGEEG